MATLKSIKRKAGRITADVRFEASDHSGTSYFVATVTLAHYYSDGTVHDDSSRPMDDSAPVIIRAQLDAGNVRQGRTAPYAWDTPGVGGSNIGRVERALALAKFIAAEMLHTQELYGAPASCADVVRRVLALTDADTVYLAGGFEPDPVHAVADAERRWMDRFKPSPVAEEAAQP